MRTENSIKNSIANVICSILIMIINFVSQTYFIKLLGAEYLGINGLFTNILSILGIVELGIGSAITYNLYKPVAQNDKPTIKSIMKFYKKAYNTISITIFLLGISIIPFLSFFIGEHNITLNLNIIYVLFLLQTVSGYIFQYKSAIFVANEKSYILKFNLTLLTLTLKVSQLLVLFLTKNYYLYLIVKIIVQLTFNIIISLRADKAYPYIKEKDIKPLDKNIEKDIFKKIKALFFHKVGGFLVNSTDNIIISKFINLYTVGLYANYNMIISAITTIFGPIISSITASVGNLIVTSDKKKIYATYDKLRFFNFWIATFCGTSLLVIVQPFITLWIGEQYLLSLPVVIVLVLNFFQRMMKTSIVLFKDAAGIWNEDKFVPFIESALNLVFSILFIKLFGLAGVFIGTIISSMALWCYSYPKFVYKKLFDRSYKNYALEMITYLILFIAILAITYCVSLSFNINNTLVKVIVNGLICLIVPNTLIAIIFRKNDNFKYFINLFKDKTIQLISKIRTKIRKTA